MEPIFHKCEADCINPVTKPLSDLNKKKKKKKIRIPYNVKKLHLL